MPNTATNKTKDDIAYHAERHPAAAFLPDSGMWSACSGSRRAMKAAYRRMDERLIPVREEAEHFIASVLSSLSQFELENSSSLDQLSFHNLRCQSTKTSSREERKLMRMSQLNVAIGEFKSRCLRLDVLIEEVGASGQVRDELARLGETVEAL